jgi:hypothetical protein
MRSFRARAAPPPKRTRGSRARLRYLSPVRTAASFYLPLASALTLGATLLAWPSSAHANGRFPESNAVFFAPNEPDTVLLRTTFGLISSRDRGKTWDWVCERAVGLAGVEDPMYSVTPDGTMIASTFSGLSVSHDKACNWAYVGGALDSLVFVDLASRPSTPGHVVALSSSYGGQDDAGFIFYKSTLFETTDEGKTFGALAATISPELLSETVDVTPSDPDRMYVSAVRDPGTTAKAFLLTSTDHGKTFVENPLPLVQTEHAAFIAAVDPINADRLYVRTSNAVDMPSRLLVSDDAGKTFRTIFTGQGALLGFALSSDGKKAYVGGTKDGLYAASTTDFNFTQRSKVEIQCLKLADDGLWACSSEKSGFVLGLTKDEGATFEAKLHFCDVRGPLTCPAGTTTNTECSLGGTTSTASPPWPQQRAVLGCSASELDGGVDQDAASGADGSTNPAGPETMDGGGGGCSVRAPAPTPIAALLGGIAASIALIAVSRRRRRR